ncbi:hypothetical protein [Flavobacterium muglaense]|uniref:Uncharacterized protein n=1 Tax=Flavobacterium muglaense TaxID=2764716 RepID=A0A923N0W7_9FLAO|nr:hypothetical protein [Flavobacterium muglaense]MBC5838102.1 hypothetical protein [Flavobacterium muglaense]MBC5844594.1 hypothetical protein [Flavobacterium muglaense]
MTKYNTKIYEKHKIISSKRSRIEVQPFEISCKPFGIFIPNGLPLTHE